jgi:hypothetical protein
MKKILIIVIFIILSFYNTGNSAEIKYLNTEETPDSTYVNFAAHTKFRYFWKDFSRAVKIGDIDNVVKMTNFPFVDYYNKAYNRATLTANDEVEFREEYTKIFKANVVEMCTYDFPITCEDVQVTEHLPGDCFTAEEKMFSPQYFFIICKDSDRNLLFGKVGGVYKLIGIKYL